MDILPLHPAAASSPAVASASAAPPRAVDASKEAGTSSSPPSYEELKAVVQQIRDDLQPMARSL